MPAQNNPGTETNFLGELPELLVVDDSTENSSEKPLALSRVPLRQIGGHAQSEDTIPQKLQLLIVVLSQRQTSLGSFCEDCNLTTPTTTFGALILPQFRPIHIGLVNTGLGENLEITESPLPSIFLKNRDRIRRSEFPILWIPRHKLLDRHACERFHGVSVVFS
jgi:hypothetical protein